MTSQMDVDGAQKALSRLRKVWASMPLERGLEQFISFEFCNSIAVASSFGAESASLLALVADIDRNVPVLFVDTGMLFDETLDYAEALSERLGLTDVRWLRPAPEILEAQDVERSLWIDNPERCCEIRKVVPFEKGLKSFQCWISGLKRSHGGVRKTVEHIEFEGGRFKLNPIAHWTLDAINQFVADRGLPVHPLVGRGYKSIGCVPCTRVTRHGEEARSGRWQKTAKAECGIHRTLYSNSQPANKYLATSKSEDTVQNNSASMLDRSWLITGVCGTIGRSLLRKVLQLSPRRVVGLDNNESELFYLYDEYKASQNIKFHTADLRDRSELESRMAGSEIVLHAAAVKHVILCEESPVSAIQANILGTQNILEAAVSTGVERVLFTSSDKAVNPTNVMGASKLMAERLVSAANAQARHGKQIFASTRFGNVLGSRGSVIPIFARQISLGGPVTLTRPEMTRFVMTLDQAVDLVMDSVFLAKGGEIFVTKMPVARVGDLAEVMIEEMSPKFGYRPEDIQLEVIGPRAGEKMYEELMNEEEILRAIELPSYFVIRPAILPIFRDIDYVYPQMKTCINLDHPYNSKYALSMSKEELRNYLRARPELLSIN